MPDFDTRGFALCCRGSSTFHPTQGIGTDCFENMGIERMFILKEVYEKLV